MRSRLSRRLQMRESVMTGTRKPCEESGSLHHIWTSASRTGTESSPSMIVNTTHAVQTHPPIVVLDSPLRHPWTEGESASSTFGKGDRVPCCDFVTSRDLVQHTHSVWGPPPDAGDCPCARSVSASPV